MKVSSSTTGGASASALAEASSDSFPPNIPCIADGLCASVRQWAGRSGERLVRHLADGLQSYSATHQRHITLAQQPGVEKKIVMAGHQAVDKANIGLLVEQANGSAVGWKLWPVLAHGVLEGFTLAAQKNASELAAMNPGPALRLRHPSRAENRLLGVPATMPGPALRLCHPSPAENRLLGVPAASLRRVPCGWKGRHVVQGEAAIARKHDDVPRLGTYGASSCVVVAVYSPASRQAVLAHVDANIPPADMRAFFAKLGPGSVDTPYLVHLGSGELRTTPVLTRVLDAMADSPGLYLASATQTTSMAIDASTGELFTQILPEELTGDFLGPWCRRLAATAGNRWAPLHWQPDAMP